MSEIKKQQILWLSDPHFDFLEEDQLESVMEDLISKKLPIVLTGDIADGSRAFTFLNQLSSKVKNKIYFVLGNHDFYGGSIATGRRKAFEVSQKNSTLCYLTTSVVHEIFEGVALIGHDGWADGLEGDFSLLLLS